MQQSDLVKNLSNPDWRIRNLYWIKDKNAQLIKFSPNIIQRKIERDKKKKKLILKARQFGVTTYSVIKRLDSAIWSKNKNVCIMAHKKEILPKIFEIVHTAYENLPDFVKPALDKGGGSKYEMSFPRNNSSIYVSLEVRGGTVHELHISEAAFIPEDRITATLQAVPKTGLITFETTPNGLNHFYDRWMNSTQIYSRLFFPWYLHSEYRLPTKITKNDLSSEERDLMRKVLGMHNKKMLLSQFQWRRNKIQDDFKGSLSKFLAEYPEDDQSCFLSSGSNPFDALMLKEILDGLPNEYSFVNKIKILKPRDKNKHYVIGVDPAEGVTSDYSAFSVWCVEDSEQVAIFKENNIKPKDFADIVYQAAQLYKTPADYPMINVERNNHGHAVILKLEEIYRYPNMWHDTDEKPGHRTTSLTRPLLVDNYIDAIENNFVKINFKETIAECLTLVDNNGKIEAEVGKHDDLFIADALAVKVLAEYKYKLSLYHDVKRKILV